MPRPQLVIFDLYGTLIQFGVKRHPFRNILQWARQEGRSPKADDVRTLMTLTGTPAEVFSIMGIFPPKPMLTQLESDIEQELVSLTLFEDVLITLNQLVDQQIPIAVCSNLAQPYGAVINRLLPKVPLLQCLSYEVGYIKPEREIYQWIIEKAQVQPEQCLFVGDTFLADYEGPKHFGFQARHLTRSQATGEDTLGTLTELLDICK
ncbi:MAG TPA: haloacid dehalogenase [Cellvibrio sp.]|jgi:HAD superfamily hydrolase (TIGR01549 family)|nr:haloacid dehalogenase [Cellvibrio sp.]